MTKIRLLLLTGIAIIFGIIFVGINDQWIIIRSPFAINNKPELQKKSAKCQAPLFYWHNNSWHQEHLSVLCSDNVANNIKQLMNAWLSLTEAEQIIEKKVVLESALIASSGQELFLSFSRNIFGKDESLLAKWMRIEGILKTIRENNNQIQSVRFLVNHQPLRDTQLYFSFSWPIQGFCKN